MSIPYGHVPTAAPQAVHIETYGCQMNVSDTEVITSLLRDSGYTRAADADTCDVLLLNTCAIRDQAEGRIWSRLQRLRHAKRKARGVGPTIGVLGCMAERLKTRLLEEEGLVDVVAGALPRLLLSFSGTAHGSHPKIILC